MFNFNETQFINLFTRLSYFYIILRNFCQPKYYDRLSSSLDAILLYFSPLILQFIQNLLLFLVRWKGQGLRTSFHRERQLIKHYFLKGASFLSYPCSCLGVASFSLPGDPVCVNPFQESLFCPITYLVNLTQLLSCFNYLAL